MTVYQAPRKPYQCQHNDATPGKCIVEGCRNWSGLKPTDIESLFGRRSSSLLAAKLQRENPAEYQRLRRIAMEENLIPYEAIPVSLRPDE